MAHVRTTNKDARIIEQCARGRRIRNIHTVPIIMAKDRAAIDADSHLLADAIDGDTTNKSVFVAPCVGKVVRCTVNAKQYPSTSGTATIKFTKAVIAGTDVDLCSTIDVDNPTDETAIDAVLSTTSGALDLVEGQLVYAIIVLVATTSERSDAMIGEVEFIPMDTSAW